MDRWTEMRTALEVARQGTISAASAVLGVHRATIVRHIDSLEEELGGRLFHRHARGYTLTEAGRDFVRVAEATHDQLDQLAGRMRGRDAEVAGELVVTSLEVLAPLMLEAARAFRTAHPQTSVRFHVSTRVFKLEYGEAHVAVRTGPRPEHPDNVVQPLFSLQSAGYAHQDYIARRGHPESPEDYGRHDWVGVESDTAPDAIVSWFEAAVPSERVVFTGSNERVSLHAIRAGMGIGILPIYDLEPELVQVIPPKDEWRVPFWMVTHVDLHRSPKVQAFIAMLRDTVAHKRL
ncbi:MAG: LysR family transcriptional regulator [Bradymonadia bacterium]